MDSCRWFQGFSIHFGWGFFFLLYSLRRAHHRFIVLTAVVTHGRFSSCSIEFKLCLQSFLLRINGRENARQTERNFFSQEIERNGSIGNSVLFEKQISRLNWILKCELYTISYSMQQITAVCNHYKSIFRSLQHQPPSPTLSLSPPLRLSSAHQSTGNGRKRNVH